MSRTLPSYGHYIDGEFVPSASGETFLSLNPATGLPIYEAADGSREDVDRAVASAQRAFRQKAWRGMTATARGRLLYRLGDLIGEHAHELALVETRDNGKLLKEMHGQLLKVPEYLYFFGGLCDKLNGEVFAPFEPGALAYSLREPLGVVGAIVPWNSPVLLAIYKIAPALAAGNTVVVKPSEHTSASILEVMTLVEQAGFPPGAVNVVTGAGAPGAALAAHPAVSKVSFTGGTGTGRLVGQAAAGHFVNASLELGGKSPQLVFADADPAQAARGIVAGIFAAAGQTCIAGSRALVHVSLYDELTARICDLAGRIKLGDPMEPDTDMGPLCFEGHRERVESIVSSGLDEGASLLTGGSRPEPDRPGWFYSPTVLGDVANDMRVAREEIFGPVLSLLTWEREEEAIAMANDTEYGLAAGIWTRDVGKAHTVAAALDAGTVWVNKYRTGSPIVPIGGFKSSGTSKENGRLVMDQYTRTKAVWINTSDEESTDLFVLQK